jgi:hypothetical protein
MALETSTYINGLVPTNPASGDPVRQGDDHIRLLKATLKATFPNISGAVTATPDDLNGIPALKQVTDQAMTPTNGGHETGFDADKLDGKHASEFTLLSDFTDAKVLVKVANESAKSNESGINAQYLQGVGKDYFKDASRLTEGKLSHERLPLATPAETLERTRDDVLVTPVGLNGLLPVFAPLVAGEQVKVFRSLKLFSTTTDLPKLFVSFVQTGYVRVTLSLSVYDDTGTAQAKTPEGVSVVIGTSDPAEIHPNWIEDAGRHSFDTWVGPLYNIDFTIFGTVPEGWIVTADCIISTDGTDMFPIGDAKYFDNPFMNRTIDDII